MPSIVHLFILAYFLKHSNKDRFYLTISLKRKSCCTICSSIRISVRCGVRYEIQIYFITTYCLKWDKWVEWVFKMLRCLTNPLLYCSHPVNAIIKKGENTETKNEFVADVKQATKKKGKGKYKNKNK